VPGTRGKITILRRRAARGESLFHPGDEVMDPFDRARVPRKCRRNDNLLGWRIVDERDYRQRYTLRVSKHRHTPRWTPEEDEQSDDSDDWDF